MEHLILALYVLVFSGGFAGLASLFMLSMRVRSRLISPLLAVELAFLAELGLVTAYFYLTSVLGLMGPLPVGVEIAISILSLSLTIVLYLQMNALVSLLPGQSRRSKGIRKASGIATAGVVLFFLLGAVVGLAAPPPDNSAFQKLLTAGSYVLSGIAVGLYGFAALFSPLTGEPSPVRIAVRGAGFMCLLFLPLSLVEFLVETLVTVTWRPLSLEYLVFLGLNAFFVAACVISLSGKGNERVILETVSGETAARFSLTPRERDMAAMIAKGLTNKEIAWELDISPATVRTHVYNLFQKVGVQSRIELLNKLIQD